MTSVLADDVPHGFSRPRLALAITAWQILFLLLLLARALTTPIDYDEEQYVAAGVMARHLMLYRDFIYLQGPADPLLLAGLYSLIGGYYLLTARLLSWVLAVWVFGLTISLLRRFGLGRGFSVALASVVLLSPCLAVAIATARNDILPLALFLAGLLLYLDAPAKARPARWLALAGLVIGLAVEAKVSYVFAPLALLLHGFWASRDRFRQLAPLAAGIAVAALPGLCYLALAPEQAWYDLLEYHQTAPFLWYQAQGQAELLTPEHRLLVLGFLLGWGSNGTLTLLLIGLAGSRLFLGGRAAPATPPRGLLLLLIALAAVTAFQPNPSWPMYYAPLMPLLAALAALLFMSTNFPGPPPLVPLLIVIAALPALPPLWSTATYLPGLAQPSLWPGVQVHRQAAALHDAVQGIPGKVATLFPTHALDANPVPAEFASGPFFFRTADPIPAPRIAALRGASAGTLEDLFERDPPAAILGGLATGQWSVEMDASLEAYAERHQYKKVALAEDLWPKGSWLYLRDNMK